jgi:DNA gyrase subunit A
VSTAGGSEQIHELDIEQELKDSYLTYAMSVIVSRALPDVRDGLKPSQRRILVAMNDLNLSPGASTTKCAAIVGETMKRYHPHGNEAIYPTLVRMAQPWSLRHPLIHGQGNFGSIAGLPPAAMRYTEARLSAAAAELLADLDLDTVDYIATYDEKSTEPTVLPSKLPNLLVNGSGGIAVGMATSIPPHNLAEVCDAVIKLIDEPQTGVDELMEIIPGPDYPTGGIICGRNGIREGYHTGRSNIVVRARYHFEEPKAGRCNIVFTEIPYQQARDRVVERLGELVEAERIKGVSVVRDESGRTEPVRIVVELKRDADRDVVLNQLYQYSPLQDTFSIIMLALVDGRPQTLSLKELLYHFIRHRVVVVKRRTRYLLGQAMKRKHTVEGLLIALSFIDRVIETIRTSADVPEARTRLTGIEVDAPVLERALGTDGFAAFQQERGAQPTYAMSVVQADAVLQMQLQRLTHLEGGKLTKEHGALREEIAGYRRLLSDERNILDVIREDMYELKKKYGESRRTEISDEELGSFAAEDLIPDENVAVTVSHEGYIKRVPLGSWRAQGRGGRGVTAADTKEGDFLEHVFVASTHAYILLFTDKGKVHWLKVYDVPQQSRTSRGRAIVNMISLGSEEKITSLIPVREFEENCFLLMATRCGTVKKTALSAYSRPMKGGIIAVKLDDHDGLIGVALTRAGDQIVLSTKNGMAIRFDESDARAMGRAAYGVKGISLGQADEVVGMVVVDADATLLTVCEHGYGKRTPFGPAELSEAGEEPEPESPAGDAAPADAEPAQARAPAPDPSASAAPADAEPADEGQPAEAAGATPRGNARYRLQRRGGKGLIDIKTTERNGHVVATAAVHDHDEIMITTTRGMMVRLRVGEISVIGRNTQGVRLIRLDEGDAVASIAKIAGEE